METKSSARRKIEAMEREVQAMWLKQGGVYFTFGESAKREIMSAHFREGLDLDRLLVELKLRTIANLPDWMKPISPGEQLH